MIRRSLTSFQVMAKINPIQEASLKESCILVNNQDKVIGNASKRDCHLVAPDGNIPLHRAFSITFPGHFTNTCCSHPLFDFEEERQEENAIGVKFAARRRLSHELGVPKEMVTLDDFSYLTRILYKSEGDGTWGEHEVDYILIMCKDLPIHPNPEEVSEVCYIGKDKFNEFIKNVKAPLTPWFKLVVQNELDVWWNNLHQLHKFQDHVNIHTFV
ncbi:hypothetical protein O3M35_006199 [Rhynocoris fuscipes]|uniref:isopentenyl-diphosphate Delta-isomerase n=1 Tax=Rhynocoris fuscipes TaxID=488301 RepID=A0AAW1DID8_9HEMI